MMIPRLSPSFDCSDFGSVLFNNELNPIEQFEQELAVFAGMEYALAFPMARSAMFAYITAMGWKGREIIIPAYTCAVVPNTIIQTGNIPVFVDIRTDDFNMQVGLIEAAVTTNTAAILLTHMYGFALDIEPLSRILKHRSDITLLQDCALAMGTTLSNVPVCQNGSAAFFSFSLGKQLSTVEGGALVTDDVDVYEAVKAVRNERFSNPRIWRSMRQLTLMLGAHVGFSPRIYPFVLWLHRHSNIFRGITDYYAENEIFVAGNYLETMPESLAGLGVSQLKKANAILSARIENSRYLRDVLETCEGVRCPADIEGASWSHLPCLVDDRDAFIGHMENCNVNVGCEVFNYSLSDMPIYREYVHGDFEVSRYVAQHIALIPNHAKLSQADLDAIRHGLDTWRQ
ncbi:DegT/DnrJ/EryC1/StrS family aminotransferase [Magnetovibrio sp. PR-2]|uniref:DegT/DnrJ/EryC1/StrS family aminotransferase n=1 Tax=Magnetovibrio sp. PR-2 TaxID=3120356 RepID=UPI002FCE3EE4